MYCSTLYCIVFYTKWSFSIGLTNVLENCKPNPKTQCVSLRLGPRSLSHASRGLKQGLRSSSQASGASSQASDSLARPKGLKVRAQVRPQSVWPGLVSGLRASSKILCQVSEPLARPWGPQARFQEPHATPKGPQHSYLNCQVRTPI